jgi:hypothetical protein
MRTNTRVELAVSTSREQLRKVWEDVVDRLGMHLEKVKVVRGGYGELMSQFTEE